VTGSPVTFTVVSSCSYSLFSLIFSNVDPDGFGLIQGDIEVTPNAAGCVYTATSDSPWAVLLDNVTGDGSGNTIDIDVAAAQNSTTSQRTANIAIGGQTVQVVQNAGPPACNVTLASNSIQLSAAAYTGTLTDTFTGGCTIVDFVTPYSSWITTTLNYLTSPVTYTVAQNNGPRAYRLHRGWLPGFCYHSGRAFVLLHTRREFDDGFRLRHHGLLHRHAYTEHLLVDRNTQQ